MAQVGEEDRELPRLSGRQPHISALGTPARGRAQNDIRLTQAPGRGRTLNAGQTDIHALSRADVLDVHPVRVLPAAPGRAPARRAG